MEIDPIRFIPGLCLWLGILLLRTNEVVWSWVWFLDKFMGVFFIVTGSLMAIQFVLN